MRGWLLQICSWLYNIYHPILLEQWCDLGPCCRLSFESQRWPWLRPGEDWWWVCRWLVRPIQAQRACLHMGHECVGTCCSGVEGCSGFGRITFSIFQWYVGFLSYGPPLVTLPRYARGSWPSDSQVLRLMSKSLRDSLRSLWNVSSAPQPSACPDRVLHIVAALAVACQTWPAHLSNLGFL